MEKENNKKSKLYKKWWFWTIIGVLIIIAAAGGKTAIDGKSDEETADSSQIADKDKGTPNNQHSEDGSTNNPGTISQQNAVKKAKSYLNASSFSYNGLIGQLEYEGFSKEDAKYGADNSEANWNEQADKKAASYMKYSSFSRKGLIDQLIYDKFTEEQAAHGVDSVGL